MRLKGRDYKCPRDRLVQCDQLGLVFLGEGDEVSISAAIRAATPVRPLSSGRLVVGEEEMGLVQGYQHSPQNTGRIRHRHRACGSLHGDAYESQLGNGGGQQSRLSVIPDPGKPAGRLVMSHMITPSPRHQDIYIEKIVHGNSASSSRTEAVVRGANSGRAENTRAPVCSQRTRRGALPEELVPVARRRRYSETVRPSSLARRLISRASSSLTLKVIVFT